MRLIDAYALMRKFAESVKASNNSDFAEAPTWNDAVLLLGSAPAIDAVPVVRCRDCKHNWSKKHYKWYNGRGLVCDYLETDMLNDDDFCSHGERGEE